MIKTILSEEPDIHWNFLHPKDKLVLDLGCDKFLSSKHSAQWFVEQGATYVLGVDLHHIGYDHPRFTMDVKNIDCPEKINSLLKGFKPDILKVDIEKAEVHFKDIVKMPSVEELAIEYHTVELKKLMEEMIDAWGFKNVETYQLFDLDVEEQGVLYAHR